MIRITALDGLDFDWEFPGFRDRSQLATLLRDTSAMLSGIASNQSDPFELSIAIPGPFTLALGFDVREISRLVNTDIARRVTLYTFVSHLLRFVSLNGTMLRNRIRVQWIFGFTALSCSLAIFHRNI